MKTSKCRPYVDKIKGHREPIIALLSPNGHNGQRLYSASVDGWLYVWDIPNKEITHKVQLNVKPGVTQLAFTCLELNENIVYGGLTTGEIYSWNIKSGEIVGRYHHHTSKIIHLQKIGSRVLASAEFGGSEVVLWDTLSARLEDRMLIPHKITAVASTEEQMFIIGERHFLYVLGMEERKQESVDRLDPMKYYVNLIVTRRFLYLMADNCVLELFDLPYRSGNRSKIINVGEAWIYTIREHSIGNLGTQLLMGCSDGSLRYLQLTP